MVKIGLTVERVAAQTFYHATWLVLATVHGDDVMAAGETQSLDMLVEALEQFFALMKMPRIGIPEFGGISDGQFTKRTVSWSVDGFHWTADNSHGEKVVRYCFLDKREATRRLTLPGSRHIGKSGRDAAVGERRDGYRSMAPTAHNVAVHRPYLQYPTSVLMRTLETILKLQEMQLMRLASCTNTVLQLRWFFST